MNAVSEVKRQYDNSRREAQARATRAKVTTQAREMFLERGYAATTIEGIGTAAGVPQATVYRMFGSKAGILSAVLDDAFGGDDEPIAYGDRPTVQSALQQTNPSDLLQEFAHLCRELLDRSAPVQEILRSAASVDSDAAELLADIKRQRLVGQTRIAKALASRRVLRDDLSELQAADIIYTLMSPEVHRILTVERHWSPAAYEDWLGAALSAQLLPSPRRR